MTERFAEWGIPAPAFNAALSGWTEFLGGLLIVEKVSGLDDFVELVTFPLAGKNVCGESAPARGGRRKRGLGSIARERALSLRLRDDIPTTCR